jgi:hypothetical protein
MSSESRQLTEYKEAYCTAVHKPANFMHDFIMCKARPEDQPVGGNVTLLKRTAPDAVPPPRLPACDEDFVATVYTSADHGTHRVESRWQDPRWSDPMRAENDANLYEVAQRDPPNRGNWYVYRATVPDPQCTPCKPLSVPDVHKMRYMSNNYMTADDWY